MSAAAVIACEGLFARRTEVLRQVASTMDILRQRAAQGAPHGTTVTALTQTAGRGRHGRTWVSAPGAGLWLSTLLCPESHLDLGGLTLCMGAGVLRAVHALGATQARLKWPNDIVVGDGKLAGVLAERLDQGALVQVLVGVGLNLEAEPPEQLRQLDEGAAAHYVGLRALCAQATLDEARRMVLCGLEAAYDGWRARGMGPTLELFERFDALLGLEVRAQGHGVDGRGTVGRVVGVAQDGGLQLRTASGMETIYAGEVTRLRPFRP